MILAPYELSLTSTSVVYDMRSLPGKVAITSNVFIQQALCHQTPWLVRHLFSLSFAAHGPLANLGRSQVIFLTSIIADSLWDLRLYHLLALTIVLSYG